MSSSSRSTTPDELYPMPGALLMTPPAQSASQPTAPTTVDLSSFQMTSFSGNTVSFNPSIFNSQPEHSTPTQKTKALASSATSHQPHPCAISPHSTAALFTRASSVSSNTSVSAGSCPTKKSRAPPSGPISTKDFIPPDVSGLNKREARLVKNRAAAFLSRQRKREEFEGLEARVEVLETDNARLYRELEAYKSGQPLAQRQSNNSGAPSAGSSTGALTAEIAGLKRQLASRDVELSNLHTRIRSLVGVQEQFAAERELAVEREQEIAELKQQLSVPSRPSANVAMKDEDSDESDSEDAQSTVNSKKELKSAGSVAAMVLLFSLSTLLTNASKTGGAAPKPPTASGQVTARRPNMHHRSDSSSRSFSASYYDPLSSSVYDASNPFTSFDSMLSGSNSLFGFDEDSLRSSAMASSGLSASDPFAGLLSSVGVESQCQSQPASGISGVKSTGPNEFEFDFTVPCSPSIDPSSSFYGTPTPTQKKQKKIRVCVKSAVPLNLDVDLAQFKTSLGSTIPSPVKFQPDDLDGPATQTETGLGKRKRVMVEIKPRAGNVRRKLSEEDGGERWDVSLNEETMEDENDDGIESDDDVLMA